MKSSSLKTKMYALLYIDISVRINCFQLVELGNSDFYGCLIEPHGVSTWRKETAQVCIFMLPASFLFNHLKPRSSKA